MKAMGLAAFSVFSGRLEGVVAWPYADILNLITVGIGNLIDPKRYAMSLPFFHLDGRAATPEEISVQWEGLKADPLAAKLGHRYAERLTTIRLRPEGIATLVRGKLLENEVTLRRRCPDYDSWPCDAQVALNSWAWAVGSGAAFPRLIDALNARDFTAAITHCHINENGPDGKPNTPDDNWGLKPRNVANKEMFRLAAETQSEGGMFDPETLRYPVPGFSFLTPPSETHVQTSQTPIMWEEITGSGALIHPIPEFFRELDTD